MGSLYIERKAGAAVETREIADGPSADFAEGGEVLRLNIDRAGRFDLSSMKTTALPIWMLKAA